MACNLYENPETLEKLRIRLSRLFTLPAGNGLRVQEAQDFEALIESFRDSAVGSSLSTTEQEGDVQDSERQEDWNYKVFNTVLNYID